MVQQATAVFADRVDAGRQLAVALERFRGTDAVVLGLPRGGVPVAFEVAAALVLPLDVIVVRKLAAPSQPEFAMGAAAEGGSGTWDQGIVRSFGMPRSQRDAIEQRERAEIEARVHLFRGERAPLDLRGRTAIVVDDGVATGATARVASGVARGRGAAQVIVAAPVIPSGFTLDEADEAVAVLWPRDLVAVGRFYRDFTQTATDEVVELLARSSWS